MKGVLLSAKLEDLKRHQLSIADAMGARFLIPPSYRSSYIAYNSARPLIITQRILAQLTCYIFRTEMFKTRRTTAHFRCFLPQARIADSDQDTSLSVAYLCALSFRTGTVTWSRPLSISYTRGSSHVRLSLTPDVVEPSDR